MVASKTPADLEYNLKSIEFKVKIQANVYKCVAIHCTGESL